MATRKITTRFAIEGETQYRQEIAQINSQMKVLDSSLKLVSSQYKENANSLEALTAKSKALEAVQSGQAAKVGELKNAYMNALQSEAQYARANEELTNGLKASDQAVSSLDDSTRKAGEQWNKHAATLEKAESELRKYEKTSEDTSEEEEKLKSKIEATKAKMDALEKSTGGAAKTAGELLTENKSLNASLGENTDLLQAAERGVNDWEVKLNTAQAQLNDTNREIQKNDQYLEEAKNSADGCATSIDEFGNQVKSSNEQLGELNSLLTSAGVIAGLKKLADGFMECVKASIEFESAMTGVEKTTDLTSAELGDMAAAIRNLSSEIPATTTELAGIAENAGQLGIQKESILGFTRVMADLGVATNLAGEEAAQAFAKFANITGMAQSDFDRLGSAVVALGNNLATTEADIANMALRLAAAGTQAGMSESEILGLAGALSSVGMEAQAGGSAFSKAINMMTVAVETGNDSLVEFAKVANMSAAQFSNAFREDAAQAVVAFIKGLGDMESHGKSAVVLLEELGLTELRLRDSLTRAANASDLFADSIRLGNDAWDENNALTKEAELRYGTTESKLTMLGNSFDNVQKTIGDQFNPALNGALDIGNEILEWLDEFIQENEWVVPVVTGVAVALGVLAVALTVYTVVMPAATAATAAFTAALVSNPIFLVVAAIGALVGALAASIPEFESTIERAEDMTTASQEAAKAIDELTSSAGQNAKNVEASSLAAERYVKRLEDLHAKGKLSNAEQEEYLHIVKQLNSIVPDLSLTINEQTGFINQNVGSVRESISAWRDYAIQQGRMETLTEMYKELGRAEVELADNTQKLSDSQQVLNDIGAERKEIETRIAELQPILRDIDAERADGMAYTKEQAAELSAEYRGLWERLKELEPVEFDATVQHKQNAEAVEISAQRYEEITGRVGEYEAVVESASSVTEDNTDTTEEYGEAQHRLQDVLQSSISRMEELETAYTEAYTTARQTIDSQIGLFDTFEHKTIMTTDAMKEAWRSQAENIQKYQENLAFASKYLNDNIALAWSDGTTESAGYVQGFSEELKAMIEAHGEESDAVRQFVDDFNAAYADTKDARHSVSETMADIETTYTKTMNAMQKTLNKTIEEMDKYELAAAAGNNTIAGLLKAYDDGMELLRQKGEQAGRAFTEGYNSQQGIQSPAKTMEKSGGYSVEGLEISLERGIEKIEKLGRETGEAYMSGYDRDIGIKMAQVPQINNNSAIYGGNISNSASFYFNPQTMSDAEMARVMSILERYMNRTINRNLGRQYS